MEREPLTGRTTFNYQLPPTAEQVATLACVVRRCRELYNAALRERRAAGRMRRVGITLAAQRAHLPASKAVRPDYHDLHAPVLQDVLNVLTRRDRAFPASLRRVTAGETPGSPRLQGTTRYDSCTDKPFGNGAALDKGLLVLAKIGRSMAVRWSRPVQGSSKPVTVRKEADGWHVCCSCAAVPTEPLPLSGRETGSEVGLTVFLVTADGASVAHPRHYRTAEQGLKQAQKRVSHRKTGRHRRRKAAATGGARRQRSAPSSSSRCGGSAATSISRPPAPWCASTMCARSRRCRPPPSGAVRSQSQTATGAMHTTEPAARRA